MRPYIRQRPNFALLALALSAAPAWCQLPCLDPGNQPVTSCSECLWRPECEWCPERPYTDQPAVGCVERGSYNCSTGEPIRSK